MASGSPGFKASSASLRLCAAAWISSSAAASAERSRADAPASAQTILRPCASSSQKSGIGPRRASHFAIAALSAAVRGFGASSGIATVRSSRTMIGGAPIAASSSMTAQAGRRRAQKGPCAAPPLAARARVAVMAKAPMTGLRDCRYCRS
ncbi:hypothetical protein [Methylocystis heyeri]|uniref:Uncharacterized protein n=1 Tax=Methylocystis heyeri TaxID=391905 RepID=A0A6B8KIH9_9HYPH|nr:hypothetical protein [Methylocystis heyeri]QGM46343.1 hypothetical protein H2LOC_011895 [Methylocystis heyeri]